jgi:FixJ family two-component response regulator
MPNLSGANVVLALRSAGSRIPVVMVSGSLVTHPLPSPIKREVFAALRKPARTSEIVSAVALALSANPPAIEPHAIRRLEYLEA